MSTAFRSLRLIARASPSSVWLARPLGTRLRRLTPSCPPSQFARVSLSHRYNRAPFCEWRAPLPSCAVRRYSEIPSEIPQGRTMQSTVAAENGPTPQEGVPATKFLMSATCEVCNTRAGYNISHHSYENGVVIIQCPNKECASNHLVADHLGWFRNTSVTIEQIMKEKGAEVEVVYDPTDERVVQPVRRK